MHPGLRRYGASEGKRFLIAVAVFPLVVTAAVVGGAVGGTLGAKKKNTAGNEAVAPPPPSGISSAFFVLGSSHISALNWTDPAGKVTLTMASFWQDNHTSLIMSLWESPASRGQRSTYRAEHSGQLGQPTAAGTPISATVRTWPWTEARWNLDFGLTLFFVSTEGVIRSTTRPTCAAHPGSSAIRPPLGRATPSTASRISPQYGIFAQEIAPTISSWPSRVLIRICRS